MVQFSEFLKIFCQLQNGLENLTRFGKNVNFHWASKSNYFRQDNLARYMLEIDFQNLFPSQTLYL